MNTMQAMFHSLLQEEFSFQKFALRLITDRLRDRGITLTRSQRATLEDRLKNLQPDDLSLALEITDAQFAQSTITDEERNAQRISLDLDADRVLSSLEAATPAIILGCIDKASDLIWKKLKRDSPTMLKDRRRERRGFETRLARRWGRAVDLLEMVREIAVEAGDDFNTEFRPEAATAKDFVFEVLTRLHARACQVGSEVITLLRSGHADGAHARWRCLHEIAVVGFFVRAHGNDAAERYILHNAIESYRAALAYQEHCTALGYEPLTEDEFARIKATRDALKARFGEPYGAEYGWAAEALGMKNPKFSDIERSAGLAHLRPYYKLASHNVHANPKGAFFKLGLLPDQQMLLAGPSDLGLADPGHGTAISLSQITFTLLTMKPNIDRLVICQILCRLEHEVGEAFIAAHRALEGAEE
ncbi:MAG: hypothetical protein HY726_03530 [Candidatus Rokubacteria bacterium]|nr:hypothetical protein [Candidatus Rokubacteria bacterium]